MSLEGGRGLVQQDSLASGTKLQVSTVRLALMESATSGAPSLSGGVSDPWGGGPFLPGSVGSVYVCLNAINVCLEHFKQFGVGPFPFENKNI